MSSVSNLQVPDVAGCFALLDDRSAGQTVASSRLYTEFQRSLECCAVAQLPQLLEQMQQALRDGLHAVTLFSYELGNALHGIGRLSTASAAEPLAEVLLFASCRKLTAAQADDWLQQRAHGETAQVSGVANLRANIDGAEFDAAIARIHAYIEAGDTYQVNYTYRLHFDAYGSPLSLYRQLRERQPVPYGALIAWPDGRAVLSLSPELFVRHEQGMLTARPMKGTAAASDSAAQDSEAALALAADPKNRAENLMIVDLLRNDLGRVAQPGSVQVPQLFEVSRYNTVLQMTSTVQAQLRSNISLPELMAALYPCGSITGAPKLRTMQIIAELEAAPRRLYTGAIGWFDAPAGEHRIGDFCLSVPIRTLLLEAENNGGVRHGEMGVGAGIVYDSVAADEYLECALKAKFLTGLRGDFSLFETMHATRDEGCRHLDLHLQRLLASAAYFGFAFDEARLRAGLHQHCSGFPDNGAHRLRLGLSADGTYAMTSAPLLSLDLPVKVLLASAPTQQHDLFLRHKTTLRSRYDEAWKSAELQGAFDMLFFNQAGELTEGGRSNVFVKLGGRWYTPPLACGLLPGVMRSVVLGDPEWDASERRLTRDDLQAAAQIMLCNALRGTVAARIAW